MKSPVKSQPSIAANNNLQTCPLVKGKGYSKSPSDKSKSKKPRRNKSAFILFSIETRAKLKEKGEEVNSNEMMVKIADEWKKLSKKERESYHAEAKKDKERYLKELVEFQKDHPSEIIGNRTKKNHVKKPCSAYALFLKEIKQDIKKEHPNLKMADVLKKVSKLWKLLSEEEKREYQERAEKEKKIAKDKINSMLKKKLERSEILAQDDKNSRKNGIKKIRKLDTSESLSTSHSNCEGESPLDESTILGAIPTEDKSLLSAAFMDSLNKNVSEFNQEKEGVASTVVLEESQQIEELPLGNQKSVVIMTTNLFPSENWKEDAKADLNVRPTHDKDSEYFNLLNFSCNFGVVEGLETNRDSFQSEYERFGSIYNGLKGDCKPRISPAEIINNEIMKALHLERIEAQKESEDNLDNSGYFSIGFSGNL